MTLLFRVPSCDAEETVNGWSLHTLIMIHYPHIILVIDLSCALLDHYSYNYGRRGGMGVEGGVHLQWVTEILLILSDFHRNVKVRVKFNPCSYNVSALKGGKTKKFEEISALLKKLGTYYKVYTMDYLYYQYFATKSKKFCRKIVLTVTSLIFALKTIKVSTV